MKVKRKVAALLAVAMVLTGQPTGVLADGVNAMSESYGATWDDGTTPSDADKENAGDIPEDEKEELAVTVNVDPEEGARVYGAPDEVETGDTLEFNVKVNDGYKLLGVDVSGEELEGDYNEENGRYYYEIENIIFDPTINVSLEKYPEFSKVYDVDGLTFTVEAEEGVIPDDAEVNIVNIEDDAESELDAESVMEEVTKKADTNKDSDPVYGAYRISISDAEGNALEDKDVKNKVTVSVSGVKELYENSELFDVDEANPIPTAVYKVEKRSSISLARAFAGSDAKVVGGDEALSEPAVEDADVSFKLDSADETVGLVMNKAPKMLNMNVLVDLYADETIDVEIEGVDGVIDGEISVGIIEDNHHEYKGYVYDNATYGDSNSEVVSVGVYVIGDNRYEYYSTDGNNAMLIEDNEKVILHYLPADYEIKVADTVNGSVDTSATAIAGDTVTVNLTPNLGYESAGIVVTAGDGTAIEVSGSGNTYTFTMPEDSVTVRANFVSAKSYNVILVPLGNSAEYDQHSTAAGKDCITELTNSVNNGETLTHIIYIDDDKSGGIDQSLVYITVNGQRIELDDGGECKNISVGDMNVSVTRDSHSGNILTWPNHVISKYYYTLEITNVRQDIQIGYFIKSDGHAIEDATITVDNLEDGIELYVVEDGENSLKPVAENDAFALDWLGEQIHFYAKARPGYSISAIDGDGVENIYMIKADEENNPGSTEAYRIGCQYMFDFTHFISDPKNRTISVTSRAIDYKVIYNTDGGSEVSDSNHYSVEGGKNSIETAEAPEKENFVFTGWEIGGKVYQAGSTITVDSDFVKLANAENQFVLTAKWADADKVQDYTVNYYKQQDSGLYPQNPDFILNYENAAVGQTVVANAEPTSLPFDISDYTVDTAKSVLTGVVEEGEDIVLKVCYAKDENGDDIPDFDQLRIVFDLGDNTNVTFDLSSLPPNAVVSDDERTITYYYNPDSTEAFNSEEPKVNDPEGELSGWKGDIGNYSYDYFLVVFPNPEMFTGSGYGTTKPVTFTPVFTDIANEYKITYDANGADIGTVPAPETYEEGAAVTLAGNTGNLHKNGAVWVGWSQAKAPVLEANEKERAEDFLNYIPKVMPGNDVKVYAVWAVDGDGNRTPDYDEEEVKTVSYTVEYYYDGELGDYPGVGPTSSIGEVGSGVTVAPEDIILIDGIKYILTSDESALSIEELSADESKNVIRIDYCKDENNDNIPDSGQRLLIFDLGTEYNAKFPVQITAGKDAQLDTDGTRLIYFFGDEDEVVYPTAPEVDDIMFDHSRYMTVTAWEDADGNTYDADTLNIEVGGKAVYKAVYEADDDNDGIPNSKEKILLTFDLGDEYKEKDGVFFKTTIDIENAIVVDNGNDLLFTIDASEEPVYPDAPSMEYINIDPAYKMVITGWKDADGNLYVPETITAESGDKLTYTAVYERDSDGDGIPDSEENVTITFLIKDSDKSKGYFYAPEERKYKVTVNEEKGSPLTAPTPKDTENDGWMFAGWDPEVPKVTPEENATYTAVWVMDTNNDGTADSEQARITFDLTDQYGAEFKDLPEDVTVAYGNEATYWYSADESFGHAPGAENITIDPAEGMAFDGWYAPGTDISYEAFIEEISPAEMIGENQSFTARYAKDGNGDGIPDYKQYVNITFEIADGDESKGSIAYSPDPTSVDLKLIKGKGMIVPNVTDNPDDNWEFAGWNPEVPEIVPETDMTYTAQWKETEDIVDENGDGIPDDEQFRVIFNLGQESGSTFELEENEDVTLSDDKTIATYWYNADETVGPAPGNDVIKRGEGGDSTVTAWESGSIDYSVLEGTVVDESFLGTPQMFNAVYSVDENEDNIPDESQPVVTVNPYSTTVYSGGTSEDGNSGFPDKVYEVTFEEATDDVTDTVTDDNDREVLEDAVTALTINGVKLDGKIDNYLQIEYVRPDAEGNYQITDNADIAVNDEADGNYLAVVMVKETAKNAFPESEGYTYEGGFIKSADGRYVTLGEKGEIQSIGITAQYRDAQTENYFVNFKEGKITVRYANNNDNGDDSEVYRDIHNDHAAVDTEWDTEGKHAEAVIAEGTTFLTNGDPDRVVDAESVNDIKLFVDDVKEDGNRRVHIQNKAYEEAYGISTEQAEAEGYNSELKYFDLVDSGNGNAWVKSETGTDVYWPYPEGTDQNTEFELIHFAGLDRSKTYNGEQDIIDAIEDADNKGDIVNVTISLEEQGIRFHTEGEHAFSPFVLMWKESSGSNNGGTSSPGAGPGASGSSYTAGVDGHWVHMSPEDINVPLSVPVPEGATPVTNPEWHQWKFFLNNGDMLYDQWAYVYNPYAVGDQPREGWFSFAENGIMEYGWYLDVRTGKWYWMHRTSDGMLGTMLTGWHYDDQDGRWYYLSPETGEMLLGWQQIDGVWYYFNPTAPETTWVYDEATGGWTWNGSASRPYGSMYVNEMTPDGYYVDENGAWRN